MSFKSGSTAFATSRLIESSPLSSLRVLFDEAMFRNIRKSTVTESHGVSARMNWDVTLDELDKFIGLVIALGILGQKVSGIQPRGVQCSTELLSRSRFKDVMHFLCFDIKSERQQWVIHHKFCLASSL